jgi:hypothetical protein
MTTLDTDRKRAIRKHADLATERDRWIERNSNTTQFLVPRGPDGARPRLRHRSPARRPEGQQGCGSTSARPCWRRPAGVTRPSISTSGDVEDPDALDRVGGPFDAILLSDTVVSLEDSEATFRNLQRCCRQRHQDDSLVLRGCARRFSN